MRVHLVRHGACDGTGAVLHGRAAGVSLNAEGRSQARGTAQLLASEPVRAVYTSPIERAAQTAAVIAEPHGLAPLLLNQFIEIDYGEWTGRAFGELADDPLWQQYNRARTTTAPPGGEHPVEVQRRAAAGLRTLLDQHEDDTVVVVSHADVIRAVLAELLGFPLDNALRLAVAPASVSTVLLQRDWLQVLQIGVQHPAP